MLIQAQPHHNSILGIAPVYNITLPDKLIRLSIFNDQYYEYYSFKNTLSKGTIERLKLNDLSNITLKTEDGMYFNCNIRNYGIIRFYRPNLLTTIIPHQDITKCKRHLYKIYNKLKKCRKYYSLYYNNPIQILPRKIKLANIYGT